ncbi:ParA family protein [Clostridium ganghwense]|uniref:AAA family ATPase n=1 Tax=Clostridium ganghwense TaxID=312089 RepID=A0ABT4CKG2_9CLOT|nr:AAA family ATPase [Clostridium ganghwense]MCY6369408.1 AAA family ATPase [Clostridium ganghwense]
MKIVSIINYKGGVGKTTLTANIGAKLASEGKRVLLIDLDPQASLTFSFISVDNWKEKYQEEKTIKSWYESFTDRRELRNLSDFIITPEKVNKKVDGKLDIICSHLGLINIDLELAVMLGGASPRQQRNNYLKVYSLLAQGIAGIHKEYDFVIIDCPPNFNIVTKSGLVASDFYIVPAKPDYLSTLGIDQIDKHVKELVNDYNNYSIQDENVEYSKINPKMLGVVSTMVGIKNDKPIISQQQYISKMKLLDIPVFQVKLRDNKSIYSDAGEFGIPVVLKKANNKTANMVNLELNKVTLEILNKISGRDKKHE